MADVLVDAGTVFANLLAAGYDKFLEYQLRSTPIFRQTVDKHPVDPTNPGPTVTLTIINEKTQLATTPLNELLDVAATAPPAPSRVTVTVDEYGDSTLETLKLKRLAFTPPDPAIAYVVGKNMVDTMDKLVQNVYDSATHVIGKNGGTLKSDKNGFSEGAVASGDKLDSEIIRQSVALLRRRNVHGKDAMDQYLALVHPDVAVDIVSDTGWLNPHQYVDTSNIYNAEVGTYLGARFIMTPRATVVADGVSNEPVYRTYFLGRQGIVEAMIEQPHVVIGPQVDRFRRFFPIGWYAHGGWAIFRQEAIQIARSSASGSAL